MPGEPETSARPSDILEEKDVHLSPAARYSVDHGALGPDLVFVSGDRLVLAQVKTMASGNTVSDIGQHRVVWRRAEDGKLLIMNVFPKSALEAS